MKRKLNIRFVAWLLGSFLILGVGGHFLHALQMNRSVEFLAQQAGHAKETGDLQRQLKYLGLYLAHMSADTEAQAEYGLTLEKLARSPEAHLKAFWVLEKVLRHDQQRSDVRRQLVDIAMELRRFVDAQKHLEILLQSSPGSIDLIHLLGACLEGNGQFAEAAKRYQQAVKQPQCQVKSYVRLAHIMRFRLKDEKTADRTMDDLVAKNKGSYQALLARGRYRRLVSALEIDTPAQEKILELAAVDLVAARTLAVQEKQDPAGKEAAVLLEAAEVARSRRNFADARTFLERGLKLRPENLQLYKSLAALELHDGQPQKALNCLRQGIKALSDKGFSEYKDLLWFLALLAIEHGEQEETAKLITRLRDGGLSPNLLDYLGARSDIKTEKWLKASATLERIAPLLAIWPEEEKQALLLLGKCYQQLGDSGRQYAAFRRAANLDPLSQAALSGMGAALVAMNKIDEAIETYGKIAGTRLIVARLLIEQNLRLEESRRQWAEVEQLLNESADSVSREMVRAELLVAKKDLKLAQKLLADLRDKHPKNVEVCLASAQLALFQKKDADALKILDEAERLLGDKTELRLARAACWAERGSPETKELLAQLTRQTEGKESKEQEKMLQGLAQAHVQAGNIAEATRLCRRLAQMQPNNLRVRLVLLDLAFETGKETAIDQAISDLERIEGPDGAFWRFGKARRLLNQAKAKDRKLLEEAAALLKVVAASRPGWSRTPLFQGEVCDRLGDLDGAIAKYQEAVKLGEQTPEVVRRVVQLMYERRRYLEADQLLQKLQEHSPSLGNLDRVGAGLALQKRDFTRALDLAQKAGLAESKDYRDHIWLGQVLVAAKQEAAAERAFRRAVALAADNPDAWVALVHFLARAGRKDQAAAAIKEAQAKLPKESAAVPLAQCHEAIGETARAKELYDAALKAQPADVAVLRNSTVFALRMNRPDDAERHLRQLMTLKAQAPEAAAWARRLLSLLLSVQGNYQKSREALALLDLVGDSVRPESEQGESFENERTRAMVLANQKSPRQRRQAIAILENLVRNPSASPGDRFLLAQLYESMGDWSRARGHMLSLLAGNDDKAQYIAQYAQGLLRHSEPAEAQPWVAKLEKLEPDSFQCLRLKALLEKAQDKAVQTIPLRKLARTKEELLLPVAQLFEELGQSVAAEELYRACVALNKRPENVLLLALHLGRQKRIQEALDLCEKAWQNCPPATVAQTCLLIITQAPAKVPHCERVDRWLQSAIDKDPKSSILPVALATLRHVQGRSEEAEAIYRQTLSRNDSNAVVLNNLAWLLAVRQGKGKEALELLRKAFEVAGPDPSLLDTRAVVYLSLGRHDLALLDLEEAVIQRPSPTLYFHLAQAHRGRNPGAALEAWRQAKNVGLREESLDPLERPVYRSLLRELEKS